MRYGQPYMHIIKQTTLFNQSMTRKIYSNRLIELGTLLGGPLVAGYLIAENFKTLNEPEKVKITWIFSILATVIIFGVFF